MTPERRRQIESIFRRALDLSAGERERYVVEACHADVELRDHVAALLAQYEQAGQSAEARALLPTEFLPGREVRADAPPTGSSPDPVIGRRLGSYKITREIGRGGMGAVYLAKRADGEFRQRVAIKLIKRGMDTDAILRRFRNERQILARLDHPYIARLLDGGTTEDGLPYFVMEFIQGFPIYRFCDEYRHTVAERLKLFSRVCDAVHFAHRNLVVHRDIKPSNILVTTSGVPKLLDFGIAKVLNPELATDITQDSTTTAMRLMTPEYASPEQIHGKSATPSSDVYSLGVLLYELLTGHRPYRLRNRAPFEIARAICEEEPLALSSALTRSEDLVPIRLAGGATDVQLVCRARGASVESLRRELSGTLNDVVLKALRKEPDQRYQSVDQLCGDITHYLEGRPVSAPRYFPVAPPTAPLIADPITTEKSLAILPFKLLDPRRAEETGDEYLGVGLADALITRLSSIRRFTVRPTSSVLRYSSPDADPLVAGRELATAFVLDGRIRRFGDSIRITVQLLDVHSSGAIWAGRFDEKFTDVLSLEDAITAQVAEAIVPHLTGDERLRLARRSTEDPRAHEAYMRGRYYWNSMTEDGLAKSLVHYTRAVSIDPHYALAYAGIADYYNFLGIYAVLPFYETAAAAKEAALKATGLDPELAEGYSALAMATIAHDFDWETTEHLNRRAIELNPNYANGHLWYSYILAMWGRFDESIAEDRKAMDLDPLSPLIHHTLAWNLYHARRYEESINACRRLLSIEPGYGLGHLILGMILRYTGERREAAAEEHKAVEIMGRSPFVLSFVAAGRAATGDREEALAILRELEELSDKRYVSPYLLAIIHSNLGDKERAIATLKRALEIRDGWLVWLAVEPRFDSLRGDSRFEDLLRQTGNPLIARNAGMAGRDGPHQEVGAEAQSGTDEAPRSVNSTTSERTQPIRSEEAQQLYVAGRYYSIKRTADGLRQAIERFERAVERDPTFALAYSELADCYALLNWYVEPPPADSFERARQAALKAVEADDNVAEAHASLGFVKLHYERDWAGAEREFRRAIELKFENAPAHRWYAFSLSAMGRHEEALREIRRAQEISPKSAVIATGVANVLFLARRFDEAIEQCRKALELDPGAVAAYVVLRWAYELKGMHKEALAAFDQESVFAGDTPTTRAKRAHVLAACGHRQEARSLLQDLLAKREEQWVTAYEIAVVFSKLGDNDNAMLWLARAEREHAVGFTFIRVDPHLDNLRSDKRFDDLLKRLNGSAG
jgi:serine/threonine protein kinase/tetratricopeptide (TPR) repeat protein